MSGGKGEVVMGGESRLFFSRTEGLDVMRLALVMIPAWATGARLGGCVLRSAVTCSIGESSTKALRSSFFPLALKAGQ